MKDIWIKLKLLFSWDDTVVEIRQEEAFPLRGEVKKVLLRELSDLAKEHKIQSGYILATSEKFYCRLKFFDIEPRLQQRIRNTWNANWR
jgi:hypothetical protein